ncbi:nucleoside triphosphate pyrophosphatase [Plantactinospora sp. KBS50]|uniref:Maf family protein n=1 Tax=Plantactinospora sp. KBS50 TaxID=2024580 RepID=UPI001E4C43BC|nr:nucleoside triphosphate pyrophosphatase [Plantactinospora sp. KBS50]
MSTANPLRFVLASASPARRKLLQAAGIEPYVLVSGVDETQVVAEQPDRLCLQLARLKAEAVVGRLASGIDGGAAGPGAEGGPVVAGVPHRTGYSGVGGPPAGADLLYRTLVLGCDSVLAFDGQVLGKPADAVEAAHRWYAMRGRSGVLYTGHCLIDPAGARVQAVAATTVHFANLDDAEIAAYVATGEPLAVAGAFTIDGLGGPFIERIEGDHGTVVGLSLPLLRDLLAGLGVRITDLWAGGAPDAG